MNTTDVTKSIGGIIATISYKNKPREVYRFPNTVLFKGKALLVNFLVGGVSEKTFITNMLFGDEGYEQNKTRVVNTERNSLFGVTKISKPVVAQIDPANTTQAIFTAVLTSQEANGVNLSEMALKMNTGDLFSMATFPSLGKTEDVEITWNWRISIV